MMVVDEEADKEANGVVEDVTKVAQIVAKKTKNYEILGFKFVPVIMMVMLEALVEMVVVDQQANQGVSGRRVT